MNSIKQFTTTQMLTISARWLDPARDRPRLAALPSGEGMLTVLDGVHARLLATQRRDRSATVAALSAVQKRLAAAGRRYDRAIRGLWYMLTALAELAQTDEEEARLLAARGELFPKGLSTTQRTYADEAGEVILAEARITPETRALLAALPARDGTVWTLVESWFEAGRAVGALDHERDALENALAKPAPGTAQAEVVRARNRWIRFVRHLERWLKLDEVDEATLAMIFQPVREAARETAARRGR